MNRATQAETRESSTLDKLLDSAAELFWEKGYATTTTREIASAAGIQQASLYYHVASKEDLLYQLGVSSLEQLQAAVESAVGQARDPIGKIRAFAGAHLATLLRHQIRHVTVLTQLNALSDRHREHVLELRKRYAAFVESLLEAGRKSGKIRKDVPVGYLYLALLNILNWAVFWFRREREAPVEEVAADFTTIYLEGALARGARLPPSGPVAKRRGAKAGSRGNSRSTPERMLSRAASLFASKGYAATSTREIAAGLGIRKASLYYHIQTKEDLLHAICKTSLASLKADVETALAGVEDPTARVLALIAAHIESVLRDRDSHAAAMAEMHLLSAGRRAEIDTLREGYEDLARAVLEQARQAGLLRTDIPLKHLALALFGLTNRVTVWYRKSGSLTPAELGALFGKLFLTGAATR